MAKSQKKMFNEIKEYLKEKNPTLDNVTDFEFKNAFWWLHNYGRKKVNEYYERYLSLGIISEEPVEDGTGRMRVIFHE